MKIGIKWLIILSFVFVFDNVCFAEVSANDKNRIIVTTDLGGTDPDDIQSMIHLLACSDIIDIEGLISSQVWQDFPDKVDSIKRVVDVFCEALPTLACHSKGYPSATYLKSIIRRGQTVSNMDGVGEGKDSPGSDFIIEVVDREDDSRPVWILAWGGTNTIAQAIWKVQNTRNQFDFDRFISKIRIYDILGQDDAGAWIAKSFPDLIYIRNKEVYGWQADDDWVRENIQAIGPLGRAYPDREWVYEGDSPSFLYLLANGLNCPDHPDYGGWGGRFDLSRKDSVRGMDFIKRCGKDESRFDPYHMIVSAVEGSSAIIKWKEHIWNDFAARIRWASTDDYSAVNHHPVAVVNDDRKLEPLVRGVKPGHTYTFDAKGSFDPDGDSLSFRWEIYDMPTSYKGDVKIKNYDGHKCNIYIPSDASGNKMHLVLIVTDSGSPALTTYRRIILNVE